MNAALYADIVTVECFYSNDFSLNNTMDNIDYVTYLSDLKSEIVTLS